MSLAQLGKWSRLHHSCVECGRSYDLDFLLAAPGAPACPECGAMVRPDVVLYEEALDGAVIEASLAAIEAADVLVQAALRTGGLLTDDLMELRVKGALPRMEALKHVVDDHGVNFMATICAICKAQFTKVLPYYGFNMGMVGGVHQLVSKAIRLGDK